MRPIEQLTPPPAGPPREALLARYSHGERLTHWAVAISYVALFLSGLAMFHPFFWWTSALFGGGAFMRLLHPFLGVAFAVLFYAYALRLVRDNTLVASDRLWLRSMLAYLNKQGEGVPVEGKYNAGQKLMYWSMLVVILVLLVTGIMMWRPYFAGAVPLGLRRVANVLHAVMAFVMFIGVGVHVYAAYWTKGSIRSMTRGTVTRAWARVHHPGWYAKLVSKDGP
jgi:formate dehydrogenase subunit gamma